MANKEFQARHGLIVNTNLLIANVITGNVAVNGNVSISNTLVVGNTNLFQRANSFVFSSNGSDALVITSNTTGVMLEVVNSSSQIRVFSVEDTGNVYSATNVNAQYFYGNGSFLTGVTAGVSDLSPANNWANSLSTIDRAIANAAANSANAYTVTVGAASNTWANATFYTAANGAIAFTQANGAYINANNAANSSNTFANTKLANTSGVSFNGSLYFPTGNVGIGTTNPTSNLHVVGTANVSTNLRVGGNVSFDNIDSVRIWEPAANTLTFHTASTERVRIANTGNVGIGTATPGEPLTVSRNTTNNNSSVLAGTVARFIGPDGVQSRVILDAYGAGTNMSFRHASGTAATPTATSSGSSIIGINGFGYGTSGYTTSTRASFNAVAAETWTDAAQGTYLSFQTTATGSLVTSEKVRIDSNGRVYIGAVPSANIQLYVGTAPNTLDSYVVLTDATIGSNTTSGATAFTSNPSTAAASFTLPSLNHFLATQGSIGAGSAITNQRGFYAFNTLTGATNNYGFFSDLAFGANRWNFYGNGTAYSFFQGAVGFGNGPLAYTQQRIGGTGPSSANLTYSIYVDQTAAATTTEEFASYYSTPSTAATSFNLGTLFHFIAVQGTKGAGSSITNQFGFYVGNNLTGATNNYGFYSNIPIGANRWNFFANGTANNYFGGNVGIGTTDPTSKLHVIGNANVSTDLRVGGTITSNGAITANGYVYVNPLAGEEGGEIQLQATGANTNWSLDAYQNNFRVFARSGSSVSNVNMFHASTGTIRLGVNRSDPGYPLDVNGTVNAASYVVSGKTVSAKAWANFNGTLTTPITPRASFNISSITKNATGDYTVNFTSALSDNNFSGVVYAGGTSAIYQGRSNEDATARTASAWRITSINSSGVLADAAFINVIVFGN